MAIRVINTVLALASLAAARASEISPGEGGEAVDARDRKIGFVTELMLPLVVNTWTGDFSRATERAWDAISSGRMHSAVLDAVEQVREWRTCT